MKSILKCVVALLAGILAAGAVAADDYPLKAIRLIAPVPPGSPPDVVARIIGEQLSREFRHPVIVDNRPGGNQTIGLGLVAVSPADGYTLGMVSLPTAVVPNIVANMPYDTLRDLAPVRELAWTSNVLIVRADSPITSVQELIVAAQTTPGKMSFASGGNGTPAHVMAEFFRTQTNVDLLHVPFKGAVEGITAVLAGHVDIMFASAGVVLPHVRAGKLRALAQTTATRLPSFPELATFTELGFPDIAVRDWQGIVAPAGTPQAILNRLATVLQVALGRPEVKDRLRTLGMEAVESSGPLQFTQFFTAELKRWSGVARMAGLRAE